ncbi:MAG: phage major capsid protein [Candidatus Nanopelagicales bacterium]|nr:phage major capsid protein [Candidatus Nanopelagicales bacterium]
MPETKTPEPAETVELAPEAADQIADKVHERIKAAQPVAVESGTVELVEMPEPAWAKDLRESIAELKAERPLPNRTNLGDVPPGGIVPKAGDNPAFYGGDDMYTEAGATPADIATNLWIVSKMLGGKVNPEYKPSLRMRQVMYSAAEEALKGAATPIPQTVVDRGYVKAHDVDGFVAKTYTAYRREAYKAMTSTGANAGDEWVPTFSSAELWRDVHLATAVSASIPRVAMPTNPYTLPTLDADVTFYYASAENTAVTGSEPNTGNATLTARKIQADVTFSGEVSEDSIIPIASTVRGNLVRRGAQTMDDLIVHGDTETAGSGNVNTDNGAPASGAFYLAFNGLRKFALVTNTGQVSNVAAALTTANFTTIRGLLGRYGARPSDLRIITGQSTLNTMYDITQVKTLDVYGPNATILQGELARFFGIPILASEATPVTGSDKVEADGLSNSTAGSLGWLVLVNVNGWKQGFRREFTLESDRNIQTDSNILVASFRMALIPSGISTLHTAVGRNVTV